MAYRVPGGEQPERKFPRMRPSGEEEEEEEESGPSSPVSYRRPGLPTASPFRGGFEPGREIYQRSSYGEADIPELFEILVPEGELRDPEFRYSSLWETTSPSWFLPRPGERGYSRGGGGEAQRDVARGGGGPRPGPAAGPGPTRPARRKEGPPVVDPRNWFDVDAIWNGVRQRKADQRFRPGAPVGIVQIAPASADEMSRARDLVRFFRIPKSEADKYQGRAIWDGLLHPFMDELSYAFNHGKPRDIPGTIGFQAGRDGSFWLGYME